MLLPFTDPYDFVCSALSPCFQTKEEHVSRSHRLAGAAALIGLAFVATAQTANAQVTATAAINATATVAGGVAPLTATASNDLQFGTVTAGSAGTISNVDANAGRWRITGEPSQPVHISFVLPATLDGAGSATIPITFGATDGVEWTTLHPGAFTTFSPLGMYFTAIKASGNLDIGITGTVNPSVNASNGLYTATISMTVAY